MISCVERIKTALDSTGLPFAHFSWSSAPKGDFGVYAEDSAGTFFADSRNASSRLAGYVDYFTRSDSESVKQTIEDALRNAGVIWWLESIQFEEDTSFIHYEWRWHE